MSNVKGPDEAQNLDFEELVAQYQGFSIREIMDVMVEHANLGSG